MGSITVRIGGRGYSLSCRDGEEEHLTALAGHIEGKADRLTASIGAMSEPRLLLMAGILVADELFELRKGNAPPDDPRLEALLVRVEALAATLDPP